MANSSERWRRFLRSSWQLLKGKVRSELLRELRKFRSVFAAHGSPLVARLSPPNSRRYCEVEILGWLAFGEGGYRDQPEASDDSLVGLLLMVRMDQRI